MFLSKKKKCERMIDVRKDVGEADLVFFASWTI